MSVSEYTAGLAKVQESFKTEKDFVCFKKCTRVNLHLEAKQQFLPYEIKNMKHKTTANLAHDSKNCQPRTAPLEAMVPS